MQQDTNFNEDSTSFFTSESKLYWGETVEVFLIGFLIHLCERVGAINHLSRKISQNNHLAEVVVNKDKQRSTPTRTLLED